MINDDSRSVSSIESSGRSGHSHNRNKFLAARSRADALQKELDDTKTQLSEAKVQNRLLEYQLQLEKNAVSSLLLRLDLDPSAAAPRIAQAAPPKREVPDVPRFAPSPPPAFVVPDRPSPPILPDPDHRRVVADSRTRLTGSSPRDAAPAPRSITSRLGHFADRPGNHRQDRRRDIRSPSPERRSGPRGGSTTTSSSPELPPLYFTEGAASRRPPHRN